MTPRSRLPLCACLFLLAALPLSTGCATVPRESIELSATVGRDLEAVHQANRNLALMHFDYLLADVDRFVDEVYRPYIIEAAVEDLDLVADFERALAGTHDLELDGLDVLVIFSEEATARIDTFRAEMRAPVEAQRDSVLLSIDEAFQQLQTANAVVTGHLASVVKVYDAQAEILRDMGLQDYRQKVATGLAEFSGSVTEVLDEAREIKSELDEIIDDDARSSRTKAEFAGLTAKLQEALAPEPVETVPSSQIFDHGGIDHE
ncbi:MAG: hypothetical protein GY838_10020 [bacterium]|nr:hypothetical protein [bacterium]